MRHLEETSHGDMNNMISKLIQESIYQISPIQRQSWIFFFFLLKDFIFWSSFRLSAKLRPSHRDFPPSPCAHTGTASPIVNVPHCNGTFVTTDVTLLLHHYHQKSIVYIRFYCQCCILYGSAQMCNDMYLLLEYHSKCFHCSKNPLCSTYSSFLPFLISGNY